MTRRHGVMSPPPHDGPTQPGLMVPGPAHTLNHASTIRNLLWIVAAALAAVELLLTVLPDG